MRRTVSAAPRIKPEWPAVGSGASKSPSRGDHVVSRQGQEFDEAGRLAQLAKEFRRILVAVVAIGLPAGCLAQPGEFVIEAEGDLQNGSGRRGPYKSVRSCACSFPQ